MKEIDQTSHHAAPRSSSTARQHPHTVLSPRFSPLRSFLHTGSRMVFLNTQSHPPAGSSPMAAREPQAQIPTAAQQHAQWVPSLAKPEWGSFSSEDLDYGKLCSIVQRLSSWFIYSPPCTALESGKCLEEKMNRVFDSPTPVSNSVYLAPWVGISLYLAAAPTVPGLGSWPCPQVAKDPREKAAAGPPRFSPLQNLAASSSHCFSGSLRI